MIEMKKDKIDPKELIENPIKLIGDDWMLITAGKEKRFNTMTANWGGVGYLWNKPVVFVFVRPERYTFEFTEANDCFSLSFFDAQHKTALLRCGATSGRDTDKIAETGLTPAFTELGTPTFQQARIIIECKKLYSDMLSPENFLDRELLSKWYQEKGAPHKMYIAEILNIWKAQTSSTLSHVAIWTNDLERSRAFYEQYFYGVSGERYENPRKGFTSYFMTFENGASLEIMKSKSIYETDNNHEHIGLAHFAYSVGNKERVNALVARLRSDGYQIKGEPRTTGDGFYEGAVLDPDGNIVEIIA